MTNALHATVNQPTQRLTEQRVALHCVGQHGSPTVTLVHLACLDCAWFTYYRVDPGDVALLRSLFGAALHRCPTTNPIYTTSP